MTTTKTLQEILNGQTNKFVIHSESGTFYTDENGIVVEFKPSIDNPITETKVDEPRAYNGYIIEKSISHLIVPEGIKGFKDDFFRGIAVKDSFSLPDGLLYIGNSCHDPNSHGCVFAKCRLPEVCIPDTVIELGMYAFGGTHIEHLIIPATVRSPYLRQFKDSGVGTLSLPMAWKEYVSIEDDGRLELNVSMNDYGYLFWPSSTVKKLEFY